MEKTMSPSKPITEGQIGKINQNLTAALLKSGLQSEPVQQVLTTKGLSDSMIAGMVAVIRNYVEAISNLIIRIVENVDRVIAPQEMLNALGRNQYVDRDVVKSMPRGSGDKLEIVLFKIGKYVSDDKLEEEFARRDLIPVDPYSLSTFNKVNPAFADEHPNSTHWKDKDGNWCYAAFGRWNDERYVCVRRDGHDWGGVWWFAGLRK